MGCINSQAALVKKLNQLKVSATFKGFIGGDTVKFAGITIGKEGTNTDFKYGWSTHHEIIDYCGERLDVKLSKILGTWLGFGRTFIESCFNYDAIVYKSHQDSLKKEAEIYQKLFDAGFSTFEPKQDLITGVDGNILVSDVLLTKRLDNTVSVIDYIEPLGEYNKLDVLFMSSKLMSQLHYNHNQIWADAGLRNMLFDENKKLVLYDFGYSGNVKKSFEFLQSNDLLSFCFSCVNRSALKPEDVIPVVLEGYNPCDKIKYELKTKFDLEFKDFQNPLLKSMKDIFFFQPIWNLNESRVAEIKDEILKYISK